MVIKIKVTDQVKKIEVVGKTMRKIDHKLVAQGLGARIVNIPELTREESAAEIYVPLGSPVMMASADKSNVYHYGSMMLGHCGMSLDDVAGYRILDADEETGFRQKCAKDDPSCLHLPVVRYYGRKAE